MFFSYIRVLNYFFMHNAYKTKPQIFIKFLLKFQILYIWDLQYIYIWITTRKKSKIIAYDPFDNLSIGLFFPQFCDVAKVSIIHKKN
jgi:hypothetical protein